MAKLHENKWLMCVKKKKRKKKGITFGKYREKQILPKMDMKVNMSEKTNCEKLR